MYIDPSLVGMLIQIFGALVISAGVVLGVFRKKIFTFFQEKKIAHMERKLKKENGNDSERTNKENGKNN